MTHVNSQMKNNSKNLRISVLRRGPRASADERRTPELVDPIDLMENLGDLPRQVPWLRKHRADSKNVDPVGET
jgi:hypothetical protein